MIGNPHNTPFRRFIDRHNPINSPFNKGSRAALRGTGHVAAAMFGGLAGLAEGAVGHNPNSMLSGTAYHGMGYMRQGLGLAARAFGQGLGLAASGTKTYRGMRAEAANRMQRLKNIADHYETPHGPSTRRADIQKKYGREGNEKTQKYGARKFSVRSPREHMAKAGHNLRDMKWGPLGAFGFGINFAAAGMMSTDNLFDPMDGMARHTVGNVAFEVGGLSGAGVGAGIGSFFGPVGAAVGAFAGFFLGGTVAAGAVDMAFWGRSEFGHKHGSGAEARKSTFMDSEYASTMRQRALQSVYRSQLNARSAFGQEALSYHG